MGMFDIIKIEGLKCVKCGEELKDFQSKDGACLLQELDFWVVDNFYTKCDHCKLWHEYTRKTPRPKVDISHYELKTGNDI